MAIDFSNICSGKMMTSDFSGLPDRVWLARRVLIGFSIGFGYLYLIGFALLLSYLAVQRAHSGAQTSVPIGVGTIPIDLYHIIFMGTFGFVGGLFVISRVFVRTGRDCDFPVAWYLTRPLQSMLLAVFMYYMFRAGEVVFYSAPGHDDGSSINIYALVVLAILTGMFTEQAYDALAGLSRKILKLRDNTPTSPS